MKQTNNAIKFLMAQYRAIYQSAYLKGLTSAIIVTASLAAPQAQAATTNLDQATSGGTITISQDSDVLELTTPITKDDLPFTVKISTGKGVSNKVEGAAVSANKATFEINGSSDTTFNVSASAGAGGGTSAAGSLTIGTLDVKKGSVTIDATAEAASLVADQVNVASGGEITASSTGAGQASLGNKTTKYKLDSGSTITLGTSGAMLGQDVVSTGGKIVLNGGSYQTPTTSAQKIDFDVAATSSITLPNSGDTLGALNIASGSTIDIKAAATGSTKELKITANTDGKGSIVVLQDGVSLKSSLNGNTDGGVISVSGAAGAAGGGAPSNSELHLTAKTLGEFLKPTDSNNASGSLVLDANSTLKFTNDSSVDIAADETKADGTAFKIASGNASVAGQVVVSGATTIDGKKITISKVMGTGLDANLSVTADELTLGDSSTHNTATLGVKSLTAKNVTFADSSTFVLADNITLSNLADDATDPTKKVAQKGTITGPVIISGTKAITVDGGLYTSTGDITISGGAFKILNKKNADASSLTVNGGNLILDRAANDGVITVSGTRVASSALLDLSKATVKYKENPAATTYNVKFKAQSGGEIKLNGEDIAALLGDGSTSGAVFDIGSGSQLTAAGDLTLPTSLIKTQAGQTSEIVLADGGTLAAEGKLELQNFDASNGLTLGTATLQASTLKLTLDNANASANSAILKDGHYVVTAGLDTNAGNGVVVSGANAKFDFGGLKDDANGKYTALSSGGATDEAIVVSGATMNVNAGTWDLSGKLTLEGTTPSLVVGNADTVLTDAGGTIEATLNSKELVIKTGTATVEKTGTLNLQKIDASGSAINISGAMNLVGSYNESGADSYAKHGIKLADDAITINEGGFLTLEGSAAEKALGIVTSGNTVTGFNINTDVFNDGGSLVAKAGSTLNITYFKEGTVLTKEALKQLSKGIFGADESKLAGSINLGKVVFDGLHSINGTVSWPYAKEYGVNYLANYKTDDLMRAQLIDVSGDTVYGHWGSVLDTTKNSTGSVTFADNASLNNAKEIDGKKYFALGTNNAVLGLNIENIGTLTLANGGIAGAVNIGKNATLKVDSKPGYTTELESISGGKTAKVNLDSGITQVNKSINVGTVDSAAQSILNVTGDLTLTADDDMTTSDFKGIVNVSKGKDGKGGDVNLSGKTVFAGTTNVAGNFTSNKEVTFNGHTTIEGLTKFTSKATVDGGGFLKAKDIELSGDTTTLYIGSETLKDASGDKPNYESSTGYLEADRVDLEGGSLFIDPDYGKPTTIAVIKRFGDKPASFDPNKDPVDVGTIKGKLIIGKNSALFAGSDAAVEQMKAFIKRYQDSTGTSLTSAYGSILYVRDKLTVNDSASRIVLDAQARQDAIKNELNKTGNGKYAAAYNGAGTKTDSDIFLGKGSVLVVGQDTLDEGSAIYFNKTNASILAEEGSKVVLDGDRFISSRDIIIFQDSGDDGINILGEKGRNDIKVESINGIMGFTMEAGGPTSGGTLKLLTNKIDSAYRGASTPMRDYLIGYASLTKNWQEYYGNTDENGNSSIKPGVDPDYFVDRAAHESIATADTQGNITVHKTDKYNDSQFVAVKQKDGSYQVFFKAYNAFLENVIRDTNGLAADQAARMGVFGGSAEAAMLVGNASYEAVAGRFGMGQQGMLMTYANNGQGGGIWLSPVYKNRQTNGFKAQDLEYGTDTSITGLALGADLTSEDGMRYGVMTNIGVGDSSGEGAANGVSSDYKYYSFGFYAGYNYKTFSIVGDMNYSVVDSDVDANTDAGKVNTFFNTTNLSLGVTGQINFNYRGLDIVPHVGLRYSMIDMEDYDMSGNGYIGSVSVSKANVMSVPVGLTISKEYFSKEYFSKTWNFKPSIDFNLTANFGDDKIDGNVKWSGISNADLNTSNEFIDDLTYGVIFGFGAQSERLSIGAGLGYQGSSNVDEFTLTGNARYTF
ncbi:MAG: autotransporter domain-containing protein [Anaerobiospirillum succiniciproducens]|uniref:autotransporter domain-containing protein n=1 Tax=Anaerobiospirillum succiniciproducens TaxID=13335 RepID=UPI0026DD388E|nr:autotransporter domain-containing protein [Anaerobiospirillum succiniciproducens]MDO4675364.1 autotransporter domain-containing protein [Anaerobiospirillum succiniciproducens]